MALLRCEGTYDGYPDKWDEGDIMEDLKDDIEEAWDEYDKLQEEYTMLTGQRYHWLK